MRYNARLHTMYSRRRRRSGRTSTCVVQGWRCTPNVCQQHSLDSASPPPLSTSPNYSLKNNYQSSSPSKFISDNMAFRQDMSVQENKNTKIRTHTYTHKRLQTQNTIVTLQ